MGRKKLKLDATTGSSAGTFQDKKEQQELIGALLGNAADLVDSLDGDQHDKVAYNIRSARDVIQKIPLSEFDALDERERRDIDKYLEDVDSEEDHNKLLNTAVSILQTVQELVSDLSFSSFKNFLTLVETAENDLEELLDSCSCNEDNAVRSEMEDDANNDEMAIIESTAHINEVKAITGTVYQMGDIKYAPVMPVKRGDYVLNVGSVGYSDVRGVNISQCLNMGNEIKKAYAELSDGRINMLVRAKKFDTGEVRSKSAGAYGTSQVKSMFPAPPEGYRVLYATIKNGSDKRNHAGGNTASLTSALITTGKHEIGHILSGNGIPNLTHANRWAEVNKGSGKNKQTVLEFQSSRDGSSFMSIYPASFVTALQKYSQGWYYEHQIARYDIGDPAMTYNIQLVDAVQKDNRVNGVLIPQGERKAPLFLSLYQMQLPGAKNKGKKSTLMALHTGEKGGSTRLAVFASSFVPSTDGPTNVPFAVEVVEKFEDFWTAKVRPTI